MRTGALRHPLPYFLVNFNGPKWEDLTFNFIEERYFVSGEVFVPGVESLHFRSENDAFYFVNKNHLNYERSAIVEHDQGHRPVKHLSEDELEKVADFIGRQYQRKNGQASYSTIETFMAKLGSSTLLQRPQSKVAASSQPKL